MTSTFVIGNIGKTPEIRMTTNGKKVASFSLAVKDYKDTIWYDVVAWEGTANVIDSYVSKGSKLAVQGKMKPRQWEDKNGNKRTSWELVATNVELLDSRGGSNTQQSQQASNNSDWDVIEESPDAPLPF